MGKIDELAPDVVVPMAGESFEVLNHYRAKVIKCKNCGVNVHVWVRNGLPKKGGLSPDGK